ncbi:4a-hydroxytetrahydrobiopterin dehydratase [Marinomonas hwangdonensis]|uniref:Putative pterin-4-alpha-carbinolamine dehydratase n=1 Tax=Marinomonas hwangdonensis TaxID=1053647 RepID=A0A3M8PZD2_9GAMM|nr:4a-hydroxytetrahydrobiopterin dehydratase [Marinomonas hwangdonensis]RNF48691.1 4a-hydroxytetrahydrobiopterin dehydratase [Marinomonas hwangdonensis]
MTHRKLEQHEIEKALNQLNTEASEDWAIEDEKLIKTFKFKDFQQAFGFMAMSALYAEKQDHHPEWFNVYNKVSIQLTTHDVSGISQKDFDLAEKMEAFASNL